MKRKKNASQTHDPSSQLADAATEILAAHEPGMAAEVVRAAHPDVGERMLRAMPDATAARIVAAMAAEHADPWRHRLASAPTPVRRD